MNTILLYPPILSSTRQPFVDNIIDITFELSALNALSSISGIEMFVYLQATNVEITRIKINKENFIQLASNQFKVKLSIPGALEDGTIYKIQGRFYALQNQTEYAYSEMSSVLITKKISISQLPYLSNVGNSNINTILTQKVELEPNPQFIGGCSFSPESIEYVDTFRMVLQYKIQNGDYITIEDSGEQRHNASAESTDVWRFGTQLQDYNNNLMGPYYRVIYSVISNNGYEPPSASYEFTKSSRNGWDFVADPKAFNLLVEADEENGKNLLYLINTSDSKETIHRNLVVSRSNINGDQEKEDITYIPMSKAFGPGEKVNLFTDYMIESGVTYEYYIQWENKHGIRSKALGSNQIENNFEYAYLYNKDKQLKLKFDNTISSFKRTTLATKQDTMGSKYPTILRSGQTSYYEFSISSLLSFMLNDKDEFLKPYYDSQNNYIGYGYNNTLVIPKEKFGIAFETTTHRSHTPISSNIQYDMNQIDSTVTANNVFVEKVFRDKVLDFLNGEQAFLYKSPTEGNIIVSLLDVSLEPKKELGRLVFSFNTQAYQIADTSIENCNKYGIFNKTPYTDLSNLNPDLVFGQLSGFFKSKSEHTSGDNLLIKIQEQEDLVEDNYYYRIQTNDMLLSIEAHDTNLTLLKQEKFACIYELNKSIKENSPDETEIANLKARIEELNAAEAYLESVYYNTGLQISINDINYYIPFGKTFVYQATPQNPITSIYLVSDFIKESDDILLPININYMCTRKTFENQQENSVLSKEISYLFGQVSGLFLAEKTGTERFRQPLSYYNPFFKEFKTWRIYSDLPTVYNDTIDSSKLLSRTNNNGMDDTEYKVYKSIDLYSIIASEAKEYVESLYNLTDEDRLVHEVENDEYSWSNWQKDKKYILNCKFFGITSMTIEAIPGTKFKVWYTTLDDEGNKKFTDYSLHMINPTGRFKVQADANSYISDIELEENAYITVGYKCETLQETWFNELSEVEYNDKQ